MMKVSQKREAVVENSTDADVCWHIALILPFTSISKLVFDYLCPDKVAITIFYLENDLRVSR